MAVIINDFELLIQPPPEQEQGQQDKPPTSAPIRPLDVADIMRRQAERLARLSAQ